MALFLVFSLHLPSRKRQGPLNEQVPSLALITFLMAQFSMLKGQEFSFVPSSSLCFFKQIDIKYKLIPGLYGKLIFCLLLSIFLIFYFLFFFPLRCYVLGVSSFVFSWSIKIGENRNLRRKTGSWLKPLQSLTLIPEERHIIDAFQIIIKHLLCLQASYRRTGYAPGKISLSFYFNSQLPNI